MPYLFDREVEAAIANQFKPADTGKLRSRCQSITAELLVSHPRPHPPTYLADDAAAQALAESMGSKSRRDRGHTPANAPHAIDPDYVGDEWTKVSNSVQAIHERVSAELAHAYQLGLDIRSPVVIGKMYKLAVKVWAAIGLYYGFEQYEGKR